jgi:hypothetical protein
MWLGTNHGSAASRCAHPIRRRQAVIESPPMRHPNMYGKMVRVIVVWQRDGSFRV